MINDSFIDKLRLSNIFQGPKKIRGNPLFDRAMELANSSRFGGSGNPFDPGPESMRSINIPPPVNQQMDVVFKPNIGEQAREMAVARDVHGVDLNKNALSPYQAGQLSLREQQLAQQAEINKGKQDIAERRMTDAEKKTSIAEISENKNLPEDKKLELINKIERGQITLRGDIDRELTGYKGMLESGHIAERGAQDRQTQKTGAVLKETAEEIAARHAKELATYKGEIDSKTGNLPSQERTATLSKAEEAKNTNPEWAKYIKIVPGGGFAVTAPGVFTGPSAEIYKAITDFIYGAGTAAPKKEEPKPAVVPAKSANAGRSRYQVTVK